MVHPKSENYSLLPALPTDQEILSRIHRRISEVDDAYNEYNNWHHALEDIIEAAGNESESITKDGFEKRWAVTLDSDIVASLDPAVLTESLRLSNIINGSEKYRSLVQDGHMDKALEDLGYRFPS